MGMQTYHKRFLLGLPLVLTLLTVLAPGIHASHAALESFASQEALLSRAIVVTERVLSELTATQTLSFETLSAAIDEHNALARETFYLLPESLQSSALHIINASNGFDPKTLQCARLISDFEDEYPLIFSGQLIAGALLYYFSNSWLGIIPTLIPAEYLSTGERSKLMDCEKQWKKAGFKNEDARSIWQMVVAIKTSPFFSAALLKMKYQNLAELNWSTSHTWTVAQWTQVEELFVKIDVLLLSLRRGLTPSRGEDEHSIRIAEFGTR